MAKRIKEIERRVKKLYRRIFKEVKVNRIAEIKYIQIQINLW